MHTSSLLDAPIELYGDWGDMLPTSVERVIQRTRQACLGDVRVLSGNQPAALRVERRPSGPPAIWLHTDLPDTAWVRVNIGERDWSKLAYQFGHELGHVFANSWTPDAKPAPPSQWMEEAIVEAFSLHGLDKLAKDWSENPPFAGDEAFGVKIREYQQNAVRRNAALVRAQGLTDNSEAWFQTNRKAIEAPYLNTFAKAMTVILLEEFNREERCIEAIGVLNLWPERSALSARDYLRRWQASCEESGASANLPVRLRRILGVPR